MTVFAAPQNMADPAVYAQMQAQAQHQAMQMQAQQQAVARGMDPNVRSLLLALIRTDVTLQAAAQQQQYYNQQQQQQHPGPGY